MGRLIAVEIDRWAGRASELPEAAGWIVGKDEQSVARSHHGQTTSDRSPFRLRMDDDHRALCYVNTQAKELDSVGGKSLGVENDRVGAAGDQTPDLGEVIYWDFPELTAHNDRAALWALAHGSKNWSEIP